MYDSSWVATPSHLDPYAHLRRDDGARPACGSGNSVRNYNTGLHVAALFLILFLSTLACSFPIIVRRFPSLPIPNHTIFISRHFGTGVLIATAFVHLFPTAYTSLTDPCLPRFWTHVYPAMAGFIAMVSVMVVVSIEMFFAIRGAGHSHHVDFTQLNGGGGSRAARPETPRSESFRRFRQMPLGTQQDDDTSHLLASQEEDTLQSPAAAAAVDKPLPQPPQQGDSDSDLDLDELDHMADPPQQLHKRNAQNGRVQQRRHVSFTEVQTTQHSQAHEERQVLQCLLLEAGILFHSVFIGMALSVSTGPAFVVLLIAISFHQTFEGLALGSRIAAISSFSTTSAKPWLMSFMYGVTTPIGQAIGLAVHGLYDPASEMGLLMVGIVNAISTGLLLYAGLVQLIAEDFLSDHSYVDLTGNKRIQACLSVFAGAMLMSLVGAFA
ncbi:hypothetical protein AMS68_000940 [Peltaster fructicola]|uniref:Zinc/iron permease n=1 Tax=Peltaster fructicola TaxID=286661 RepID=A0A6H0XL28_9PEZI|nr:hypothetical protein AMS68_000940 [Peltaster fructicola]